MVSDLSDEQERMISVEISLETQTIENFDDETLLLSKSKIKKLRKKNNHKKSECMINLVVIWKGLPPLNLEYKEMP